MFKVNKFRPFQISCGLLPGYDARKKQYGFDYATECIGLWIARRVQEDKKVVVGTILPGALVYPWKNSLGYQVEDSFQYRGMVREDASDEEAEEMLKDTELVLVDPVILVVGDNAFAE